MNKTFVLLLKKQKRNTMTAIQEYDRTGWKGFKFEFVCDEKYLTIAKNPKDAIKWFVSFKGVQPKTVKQVSKYPSTVQS